MLEDYLLSEKLPLFWCAGCGNGVVLQSILREIDRRGWTKQETVIATGIGCWGKADDYVTTNSFHGTHGRALAFSTGIKLANPSLHVVTLMGDGDGITIGGNHLIHAARRNLGVTAIMVNNLNYGMTGGQYSGTTPTHSITQTSPYGHIEQNFDVCKLAIAAGASYVGRATAYNPVMLRKLIKEGMQVKGFSLIEVMSACPTHYGKFNKLGAAAHMMQLMNEQSVTVAQAAKMSEEELQGKIVVGCLKNAPRDDYYTDYKKIIDANRIEG